MKKYVKFKFIIYKIKMNDLSRVTSKLYNVENWNPTQQ